MVKLCGRGSRGIRTHLYPVGYVHKYDGEINFMAMNPYQKRTIISSDGMEWEEGPALSKSPTKIEELAFMKSNSYGRSYNAEDQNSDCHYYRLDLTNNWFVNENGGYPSGYTVERNYGVMNDGSVSHLYCDCFSFDMHSMSSVDGSGFGGVSLPSIGSNDKYFAKGIYHQGYQFRFYFKYVSASNYTICCKYTKNGRSWTDVATTYTTTYALDNMYFDASCCSTCIDGFDIIACKSKTLYYFHFNYTGSPQLTYTGNKNISSVYGSNDSTWSMTYGNGIYIMIIGPYSSSTTQYLYSTDGKNWSLYNLPNECYSKKIVFHKNVFVYIGAGDSSLGAQVLGNFSSDGINWFYGEGDCSLTYDYTPLLLACSNMDF